MTVNDAYFLYGFDRTLYLFFMDKDNRRFVCSREKYID
jgi:hypothetical protein